MYPDCEEILKLAPDYDVIPVCREIYADVITPITLLRKIAAISERYYLLFRILRSRKNTKRQGRPRSPALRNQNIFRGRMSIWKRS